MHPIIGIEIAWTVTKLSVPPGHGNVRNDDAQQSDCKNEDLWLNETAKVMRASRQIGVSL